MGYGADWISEPAIKKAAWINIQPTSNPNKPIRFSLYLDRARNLLESFFNKIKRCRRLATRYDKFATDHLAFNCVNQALALP